MSAASLAESLTEYIRAHAAPAGLPAFEAAQEALNAAPSTDGLISAFAAVSRQLGKASLKKELSASLQGPEDRVPLAPFTVDMAGRALLLLTIAEVAPSLLEEGVWEIYRQADAREKIAVVRSLSLLPEPGRFLQLALDAGRTNETSLFNALACSNPFPARHYPELEFNKLYMKAAFLGAPLDDILGLATRANRELSRMAADYVTQQEAATRSFPPELWMAVSFFPPPGNVAKMLGYSNHAGASMRLWAVRAIARTRDRRTAPFLDEQLALETDKDVRDALIHAIARLASEDRSR